MTEFVRAEDVVFELEVDSVFYEIMCVREAEFIINQDEIEKTSPNSGRDREYIPGMSNGTLNISGITEIENGTRISINWLLQNRATVHSMRMTQVNDAGDTLEVTFNAFLTRGLISGGASGMSYSDADFRISGTPSFSSIITNPTEPACEIENTLYKTLAEGATSVTDALLQQDNVVVLWVTRSNAPYYYTSGTPGSLQYAEDLGTGTISFDPDNPGNAGGENVSIGYKISE